MTGTIAVRAGAGVLALGIGTASAAVHAPAGGKRDGRLHASLSRSLLYVPLQELLPDVST